MRLLFKEQIEARRQQPLLKATTVNPEAIAMLKSAIPPKSQEGSYAANNVTELKKLVEQAIALLERKFP